MTVKETDLYADPGDYLKAFAVTAVMGQSIIGYFLALKPPYGLQDQLGILYNLIKFNAPAFIFSIVFTTIGNLEERDQFHYGVYLRKQWHLLFIPSIWWTAIYLIFMPWLQQGKPYHSFGRFCWQFINGNAAPHLWYNTMMLQFIILMPLFQILANWVGRRAWRAWLVLIIATAAYCTWLEFYQIWVFHGPHETDWYLLDRFFVSFFIYGVCGCLAWLFIRHYHDFVKRAWLVLIASAVLAFLHMTRETVRSGHPLRLYDVTYYKPVSLLYCILVIMLGSGLWFLHYDAHREKTQRCFHFLAVYAYRAYLGNVFFSQLLWLGLRLNKVALVHPWLVLIFCWVVTWFLSLACAWLMHQLNLRCKALLHKYENTHSIKQTEKD